MREVGIDFRAGAEGGKSLSGAALQLRRVVVRPPKGAEMWSFPGAIWRLQGDPERPARAACLPIAAKPYAACAMTFNAK